MTAIRVVDDHLELVNIGSRTHSDIDLILGFGSFLLLTTASLTGSLLGSQRYLNVSSGLKLTDLGPQENLTLGIDNSILATLSGSIFTGAVKFNSGVSGSLQKLSDGTSYLTAGSNVTITTASSGQITISSTGVSAGSGKWVKAVTLSAGSYTFVTGDQLNPSETPVVPDLGLGLNRVDVYLNGQLLTNGASADYTATGDIVTFVGFTSKIGDVLSAIIR